MGLQKKIHKLWHSTNQLGPQFEPSPAPSVFQYSNMSTTLEFPTKIFPKTIPQTFSWWIFLSPYLNPSLVGGFNPFEKYSSNWIISPRDRDENKKYLSCHHPGIKSDSFIQHPGPKKTPLTQSDQNHPPPPWADFARGNIS